MLGSGGGAAGATGAAATGLGNEGCSVLPHDSQYRSEGAFTVAQMWQTRLDASSIAGGRGSTIVAARFGFGAVAIGAGAGGWMWMGAGAVAGVRAGGGGG